MKILIFSDLQADEGSERLRSDPSVPLQRWRVRRFFDWAAGVARARGAEAVWDLGDTTNNRSAVALPTLQEVSRGAAVLTAGTSPVLNFKLIGNHEQHTKSQEAHVGGLFSPCFHVVESRGSYRLPGGLTVVCCSFPYDNAEAAGWIRGAIAAARSRGERAVFLGHILARGARLSSGIAADGAVPPEAFADADLALLGHVHRRQRVGRNGWYVGSPFQQDFGEAGDPQKAVAVLDTETLALEWVATPFPVYRTVTVGELEDAAHGDDVLKVVVKSSAEAQRLYASPHAGTVQPVYAFSPAADGSAPPPSDFHPLARQYASAVPLPGVSEAELLAEAEAVLS